MSKDKIKIEKQNIDHQKEKEKARWKKKYYNECEFNKIILIVPTIGPNFKILKSKEIKFLKIKV